MSIQQEIISNIVNRIVEIYYIALHYTIMNVDIAFYTIALIGSILIFSKSRKTIKSKNTKDNHGVKYKKKRSINFNILDNKKKNFIDRHVEKVVLGVFGSETSAVIQRMYYTTMVLAFTTTFICIRTKMGLPSIGVISIVTALPYIFLRLKVNRIKVQSSHEGAELISELLNNYKIYHKNMLEAIDQTITVTGDDMHIKKILLSLTRRIKENSDENALREALNDFAYSINTQWAKMLANNIYVSITYDIDVILGMEDIIKEMEIVKEIQEARKQETAEGDIIAKYLMIGIFLLNIFLFVNQGVITFEDFIKYSISSSGAKLMVYICIAYAFGNIANSLYNNRKFDV